MRIYCSTLLKPIYFAITVMRNCMLSCIILFAFIKIVLHPTRGPLLWKSPHMTQWMGIDSVRSPWTQFVCVNVFYLKGCVCVCFAWVYDCCHHHFLTGIRCEASSGQLNLSKGGCVDKKTRNPWSVRIFSWTQCLDINSVQWQRKSLP